MQISSFSSLASTARSTVKALAAAAVAEQETDAKKGDEAQAGTDVVVADAKRAVTQVKSEAKPVPATDDGKTAPKKGARKGTVLDAYA